MRELLEHQVAAVVAERVVDLLEAVEVHEQHGDSAAGPCAGAQRVVEPVEEERAVGEAGQVVVEREPLVLLRLATELARRARYEAEDADPEKQEAAADEGVRRAYVGRDRALDRRVRQVELERTEHVAVVSESKRDAHLVRLPAPVTGRHAGGDVAAESAAEPGIRPVNVADRAPVVGVEDTAAAIPQRHAGDARGLQARDRPVERAQVALAKPVAELVRRELGLERGRDENRRLTRVRVGARANLVLEVLREAEAEQSDRDEADERERREQARPPAAGTESLPQSLTIFGTNG